MSDYTKIVDFATKDTLPSGNPLKLVKGTELDNEFNSIQTNMTSKANKNNAALTGAVTVTGSLAVTGALSADTIDGGTY